MYRSRVLYCCDSKCWRDRGTFTLSTSSLALCIHVRYMWKWLGQIDFEQKFPNFLLLMYYNQWSKFPFLSGRIFLTFWKCWRELVNCFDLFDVKVPTFVKRRPVSLCKKPVPVFLGSSIGTLNEINFSFNLK